RLDLSKKSTLPSFHFTFGLSGSQQPNKGTNHVDGPFTELRVVRDRNAYAAILFFSDGPSFYCTSDGMHSVLAMVTPGFPSSVWVAKSASIYCAAMLTTADVKALKFPWAASTYQFGITMHRPHFPICLRTFGFIRAKLLAAHEVKFISSKSPTLSLWWPNMAMDAEESLRASFNFSGNARFPLKQLTIIIKRGGSIVGTAWISHVGPGIGRNGPTIHRITGLQSRAALPWHACSSGKLYQQFALFTSKERKPPLLSPRFISLRKRFLKWAITPDVATFIPAKNDVKK
ncbi:MAG: hypothetical protein ACYCUV_11355, partial [Phycisphaerae bacterium]